LSLNCDYFSGLDPIFFRLRLVIQAIEEDTFLDL
jgi:hypothetical protein